ncbi:MAG: ABC transporter-like protein [Rhodospirillaceae bacterium]|nr:MAG: ABC transporter-like protein [Rhodospirillaceae bacterium]
MAELGSVIRGRPVEQFWRAARGFWRGNTRWYAWGLIAFLVVCVILQLLVQYRLNLWNRDFFNALGRRDGSEIWQQARAVLSLVAQSVVLAIAAVWGRMSFQRRWRAWLTSRLILNWFSVGGEGDDKAGESEPQFIEYRIADDARIATDAPIDFAVGLLASVLTAGTFAAVLWNVGGSLSLAPFGIEAQVPGYLVLAAVLYAASTTTAMMVIGGNMASVIERKSQAESEFKFAVARLRENLMSRRGPATSSPDKALVVPRRDKPEAGHLPMASPLRSAHADHPCIPWQLPPGAVDGTSPLCTELRPWAHAAGRDDPIGGRFRCRAGSIQLVGGQLSSTGGLGVVCRPGRRPLGKSRRCAPCYRTSSHSAAEAEGISSLIFLYSHSPEGLAQRSATWQGQLFRLRCSVRGLS